MFSKRFWLKRKYWFTDKEIDTYKQLCGGDISKIKDIYLSSGFYTAVRPYLDEFSWHPIIHNKWICVNYYQSMNIEMPETYGLLHNKKGFSICGDKLKCAKDLDALVRKKNLNEIVIKHIGGGLGNYVFVIDKINKNQELFEYTTVANQKFTHKEINEVLSKKLGGLEGYLVEKKLTLHPVFNEITGGGLSSIRVETLCNGKDVNKVQMAFVKFGIHGKATDHSSRGGIYVPIDVESGTLKKGIDFTLPLSESIVSRHTVTNKNFEGLQIPYWKEVVELALEIAKKSPGLNYVGWDIMLTDEGPRLMEGNVGSGLDIVGQRLFGGYMENGVFEDWVNALDIPKPVGSLRWKLKHWNKGRRLKPFEQFVSSFLRG
jgi:hypothetical protein